MKGIAGLLLVSGFLLSSFATANTAGNSVRPESVHLFDFAVNPQEPHANQSLTIFANLVSGFDSANEVRPLIQASFNGQGIQMLHPTEEMWMFEPPMVTTPGLQTLNVTLYIENKNETDQLRSAISQLEQEISVLEAKIRVEEDPAQKLIWQAQKNQKEIEKNNLNDTLNSARTWVGNEEYKFNVAP